MPGIGIAISPHFRNNNFSLARYWATLISATVENAAPTHVVLTFASANNSVTSADFTVAGFTVSSGSWAGAVFTIVVNRPVTFLDLALTITFIKTGTTAVVTNNVTAVSLLAYYDHVQGADADVLYDKSGNAKHGNLGDGAAAPVWSATGNTFAGGQHIDLPNLTAGAAPCTVIYSRSATIIGAGYKYIFALTGNAIIIADRLSVDVNYPGCTDLTHFNGTAYVHFPLKTSSWSTIAFVVDAPSLTIYINGVKAYVGAISTDINLTNNMTIGSTTNNDGSWFYGIIGYTVFHSAALTDAQVYAESLSLNNASRIRGVTQALPTSASIQVICDGDSLTSGYAATGLTDYPNRLMYYNNTIAAVNLGVPGQRISTMDTNGAAKIDPLYMSTGVSKSVCVAWAATNDIFSFGQTDVQAYNSLVSYCQARQATGFKVIAVTCIARTGLAGPEAYRVSFNTMVRTNWATFADGLCDLDLEAEFSDYNDTTYYNADKVHLTATGYDIVAQNLLPIILSV